MTTHMENNHNDNQTKSTSALNQEEIQMYLKDIRKIKVMTPDRERELSDMMCSGKCTDAEKHAIYQELLEGNLRFVITVAKQYQNQGMELGDLIAEGNLGLMKAIKNFDWTKKLRFISYAVWWIKQSIMSSLNENSRMIRLPSNIIQDNNKRKKSETFTETQFFVNYDESDGEIILPHCVNLHDEINEDGEQLLDTIVNPNAESPEDILNTPEEIRKRVSLMLSVLDDREKVIIEKSYGLNGVEMNLEDLGEEFGCTKERIRQLRDKALKKLRNDSYGLLNYL